MNRKQISRRAQLRVRRTFPAGMFVSLLTGSIVTLVGIFSGLEPMVILVRSFVSAVVLGCLMSLGISIVRLANSEYKKRNVA